MGGAAVFLLAAACVHGTKLHDFKYVTVDSRAFLPKQHRTVARSPEYNRGYQHDWTEYHQAEKTDEDIARALQKQLHQRGLRAVDIQEGRVVQDALLRRGNNNVLQLSQKIDGFIVLIAIGLQLGLLRIGNARQKDDIVLENGLLHVRAFIMHNIRELVFLAEGLHLGRDMVGQLLRGGNDAAVLRRIDAKIIPIADGNEEVDKAKLQNEGPKQKRQILSPENELRVCVGVLGVCVHDLQNQVRD